MIRAILLPTVVLALLAVLSFVFMKVTLKGNRKFEAKSVIWYALVVTLLFAFVGLVGLLVPELKVTGTNLLLQACCLSFGIFHVWFLFSNYDWPERDRFIPETLATLLLTAAAGLGLLWGLWGWNKIFGTGGEFSAALYKGILCIPVPYLFVRTFDYLMAIPHKRYVAWAWPSTDAPRLNLNDANVVFIYMNVSPTSDGSRAEWINNHRSRLPKDVSFADFFVKFVNDMNQAGRGTAITHLESNGQGQAIGWHFYAKRTERSRKTVLNPYERAFGIVQEGDFVYAERVLLGQPLERQTIQRPVAKGRNTPDDDIIIFEK